jgi:DNA replication protein DnaC
MFETFVRQFSHLAISQDGLVYAYNYFNSPPKLWTNCQGEHIQKNLLSTKPKIQEAQIKIIALSYEANLKPPTQATKEDSKTRELEVEANLKALNAGKFTDDYGNWVNPPIFHNHTAKLTEPLRYAKAWNTVKHNFFLLKGVSFAGKTFAGISALTDKMQARKTPQGVTYNGLFVNMQSLKNCMGAGDANKDKRKEIISKPYLMIDDLQAGDGVTVALAQWLKDLIDDRWMQKRPTIITTNASEEDLITTYSEAIINRIKSGLSVLATEKVEDLP